MQRREGLMMLSLSGRRTADNFRIGRQSRDGGCRNYINNITSRGEKREGALGTHNICERKCLGIKLTIGLTLIGRIKVIAPDVTSRVLSGTFPRKK
jgi:hypothetical protein